MKTLALSLVLTFLCASSPAQAAERIAPAKQVRQATKRAKVVRWVVKTARATAHTVAGLAGGAVAAKLATEYGMPADPTLYRGLFGASAYATNEAVKAVTGRIFRRQIAKYEGPSIEERHVPEKLRHKALGATIAAFAGTVYDPFLAPQWLGKSAAQWAAQQSGRAPQGPSYEKWLSKRVFGDAPKP